MPKKYTVCEPVIVKIGIAVPPFNPYGVLDAVIEIPSVEIKVPPDVTPVVALLLKLRIFMFWFIVTLKLFVNTSSDAVGIIDPDHMAALLQLPDVMGHLFGIL